MLLLINLKMIKLKIKYVFIYFLIILYFKRNYYFLYNEFYSLYNLIKIKK